MELHESTFTGWGMIRHVPHPSRRAIAPARQAHSQRALVHVHADEFVRELPIEITRKLHRISQRFFAMNQAHTEYLPQCGCNLRITSARRLRRIALPPKAREASHAAPPSAQINNAVQPDFALLNCPS